MKQQDIQSELFKIIRTKLIGVSSLGNALSKILHISPDAVYRRYRGETSLTIQETKKLCKHFDISFDALTHLEQGKVIFQYASSDAYDFSLEYNLYGIAESFNKIRKLTQPQPQLILTINNTYFDSPQFYHYLPIVAITSLSNSRFTEESSVEFIAELIQICLQVFPFDHMINS